MTFDNTLQNMIGISPFFILKLFILLGLMMYLAFALVVVRQIQLMSNVVGGGGQYGIKLMTLIHLAAILLIFVLALLTL
ncbi:hypothetical protein HY030_01415 [Candidatus Gottesmanbacteria bacterium]|nr:hypothetical protein [Candidatus Gottesmanbacteria bacterium]